MENEIETLHKNFSSLVHKTLRCLNQSIITTMHLIVTLTSTLAVDAHKQYLKRQHHKFQKCTTHTDVFYQLNLYWDYLSCDLLDKLIVQLSYTDKQFKPLKTEMGQYKRKMQRFRRHTTLILFCTVNKGREDTIPQAFKRNVYHALRQKDVTLDHVEKFREDYARTLNLKKCARMVHQVLIDRNDKRR